MPTKEEILNSPHFKEFMDEIRCQLDELQPDRTEQQARLQTQLDTLQRRYRGWSKSLGDPDLDTDVRVDLQKQLSEVRRSISTIEQDLRKLSVVESTFAEIDPKQVADNLERLAELLVTGSPSALNVELSRHIAAIRCDSEGGVSVVCCKLGALGNPAEILPYVPGVCADPNNELSGRPQSGSRRRTRRDLSDSDDDDQTLEAANDFAVDPTRFAGLGPEWFTEDRFQIPQKLCWAEEHAVEVAEYRLQTKVTLEQLALHFGKTAPTVNKALRIADERHGIQARGQQISVATRKTWSHLNQDKVICFLQQPGRTIQEAAAHFGKSANTISKIRREAIQAGTFNPEARTNGCAGRSTRPAASGPTQ